MPWQSLGNIHQKWGTQELWQVGVDLCLQGWLLLNSSLFIWEVEKPRVPRPSDSVREARNPDVCENTLVFTCQHQIQIKITFPDLCPWTPRLKSSTRPDLSLQEPPGQSHYCLSENQSRAVKGNDTQERAGSRSRVLSLFCLWSPLVAA